MAPYIHVIIKLLYPIFFFSLFAGARSRGSVGEGPDPGRDVPGGHAGPVGRQQGLRGHHGRQPCPAQRRLVDQRQAAPRDRGGEGEDLLLQVGIANITFELCVRA